MKKFHEISHNEMQKPRYRRALRFADTMMSIMDDFLPYDRDIRRHIEEHLMDLGYEGNVEIINVPAELDALNKAEIERRMIETHPLIVNLKLPI